MTEHAAPEYPMTTVRKDDLDVLVLACLQYMPDDQGDDVRAAFSRLDDARHQAGDPETASSALGEGQFLHIAFMGHTELTGWVTEITLGGEPAYHIDLPDKLWGGNPLAWEEYSAKVLFGRSPVTEESVRKAWEAQRRLASERARREAEWQRMQEQRAIEAASDDDEDDDDPDDEGEARAYQPTHFGGF